MNPAQWAIKNSLVYYNFILIFYWKLVLFSHRNLANGSVKVMEDHYSTGHVEEELRDGEGQDPGMR